MGAIYFSLDPELAKLLLRKLKIRVFFETGTFEAATALSMAPLFERIYTVELSEKLYNNALRKLAHCPNVKVISGSSPDVLRARAAELRRDRVLYWLDAHWCDAGGASGAEEECVLLAELQAIGHLNENSAVLIDDARFFLAPPPPPHDPAKWPDLLKVITALRNVNDGHALYIINDTILFVPTSIANEIVTYGRNRGVDLFNLAQVARKNHNTSAPLQATLAGGHGLHAGFNLVLLQHERSERIFAFHAQRLGITRLLDIGSHAGQFAKRMRKLGYNGMIYSVEPQAKAHALLRQNAQTDVRWIPLTRQAAGSAPSLLKLNISENSWSSSLLPVHNNHLRAEPSTRTIAQEEVHIARTADLLHESVIAQVDAVKIDVQGYESQVLEGLRSLIDQVQLLLVEMSLVECYVGGPDLFAVDRMIVDDLGFKRVSFEPSYYDDTTGTVQQYDGIYVREPANTSPSSTLGRPKLSPPKFAALVTSLNGKPNRIAPHGQQIGDKWLELCVQSWRRHATRVVSVSELAPPLDTVDWIRMPSRPSLAEIFALMDKDSHTILCNADIMLNEPLTRLQSHLDPLTVYLAHRVEVELNSTDAQLLNFKSLHNWGFDVFILPPRFVRFVTESSVIPMSFRIGEPWWDYLIPIAALAGGFPVKRLPVKEPVALHYEHPRQFDYLTWQRLGIEFFLTVTALARSTTHSRGFIEEIARIGTLDDPLNKMSVLICTNLP